MITYRIRLVGPAPGARRYMPRDDTGRQWEVEAATWD